MVNITRKTEVQTQAKVLSICSKVSDNFSATLLDQNGEEIHNQPDGYVPSFMPGKHYGDYLMLDIDLDTGQVLNWAPPTAKQIEEWLAKSQ